MHAYNVRRIGTITVPGTVGRNTNELTYKDNLYPACQGTCKETTMDLVEEEMYFHIPVTQDKDADEIKCDAFESDEILLNLPA